MFSCTCFFFPPLLACIIGQSLGANWLAEPTGQTVPVSIPGVLSSCHCLHTASFPPWWEGAWQLPEKTGATSLPGDTSGDEVRWSGLSVEITKNTQQCARLVRIACTSSKDGRKIDGDVLSVGIGVVEEVVAQINKFQSLKCF